MVAKDITFQQEARKKLIEGCTTVYEAVKVTLGPKGKNVMIEQSFGAPRITKDGVTVAKAIEVEDKIQNIGAQLIKTAASKTADTAGDGTTTCTVLSHHLIQEANKQVAAGINPEALLKGMEFAVQQVEELLKSKRTPIKDKAEIEHVATIASNNDAEIGRKIAQAIEELGKEAVITVEEGKSLELELDIVKGMVFDKGYISPHFHTNHEKMITELETPYVMILDKKLSALQPFLPLLEAVATSTKPLLIIAEDVEGEVLTTLILNKLRGVFKVAAVKAPGFGDRKKAMLEDIAVLTGATVISDEMGIKLEKVGLEMLGSANKVRIDKDSTTIVEGKGKQSAIAERCAQIKMQISESSSDYEKEKLQERLAKLSGGVAVLKVGGMNETEVKERKDRVEDAVHATKAALEQGIVPGGGAALFYLGKMLHDIKIPKDADKEMENGVKIVANALKAPITQILFNGGYEPGEILAKLLKENSGDQQFNMGFDARTGEYVNMLKVGIIDPSKVVITALKNACAVAKSFIMTEAVICDKPSKKDSGGMGAPYGPGGMGGMDY